jgi:hypothetical protein
VICDDDQASGMHLAWRSGSLLTMCKLQKLDDCIAVLVFLLLRRAVMPHSPSRMSSHCSFLIHATHLGSSSRTSHTGACTRSIAKEVA